MSGNALSKCGRSAVLLALLAVCGMARDEPDFPQFDGLGPEIEKLKAQRVSLEARIQSGEVPAQTFQPYIDGINRRLAEWEPHHHPDLRRYWAEQGRTHAQSDLAKGRLRLFHVTQLGHPYINPGIYRRPPPLDEFEVLLNDRLGASLVRVRATYFGVDLIAVNTRCDGYNMEVERHLTNMHGGDIVSLLWRRAEREARSAKDPLPTAREVWLPFAASGASFCLLVGLVLIRRRREGRRVNG